MPDNTEAAPIAILHLSDFHFKTNEHPVLDRAEHVIAAIRSVLQPFASVVVAVTGDIAFSGLPEEYLLADAFFRDLFQGFAQAFPGIGVTAAWVPGNHDCDLKKTVDIREYALLRPKLPELNTEGMIAATCLSVQDAFFSFVTQFGQDHQTPGQRLSKRLELTVAGTYRIGIGLYDTSWLSQDPERPGQLYVPDRAFLTPETPADLELALMHHPLNWLDPDNGFALRAHLQNTADMFSPGTSTDVQKIAWRLRREGLCT